MAAIAVLASSSIRASLPIFVRDFVQPGAGDATSGILTALASAAAAQITTVPDAYNGTTPRPKRPRVVFPAGLWNVSQTITIPQGVDVEIQADAYVKATAEIDAVFDTALNVVHQDGRITCHGTIDCAGLAATGIYLRSFAHYEIETPRVYSPVEAGVILGDPASTVRPYEGLVRGPYIWRPNGQAVPEGSVGLWTRYATDSAVGGPGSVVVGCDIGVRNSQGNNTIQAVHVWGYPPNPQNSQNAGLRPSVAFLDETSGAIYLACYADTPTEFGWRFTADNPNAQISASRFYMNSSGTDNTVTAVRIDSATTGSVASTGLTVRGSSVSKRVAADFSGTLTGSKRLGTLTQHVVTVAGDTV